MNLNELKCLDCDKRMIVVYYEGESQSHTCRHCKFFHTLENPEDFAK